MSQTNAHADDDAFAEALAAADRLNRALSPLRIDQEGTQEQLRTALRRPEEAVRAILLLETLGTTPTKALVDDLLVLALQERRTMLIRNLLGRLPWREAKEIVPPAVRRLLDDDMDDSDAYRRMAELLYHLDLDEALHELCARAEDSIDPDVREIAADFGR
jgi:hypothetical protein